MRLGIAVVLAPLHHPPQHRVPFGYPGRNFRRTREPGHRPVPGIPTKCCPTAPTWLTVSEMVKSICKSSPGRGRKKCSPYEGKHSNIPPREVIPKPVQKPHPPIWQAVSQEFTAEKVGRQGLGCLAQNQCWTGPRRRPDTNLPRRHQESRTRDEIGLSTGGRQHGWVSAWKIDRRRSSGPKPSSTGIGSSNVSAIHTSGRATILPRCRKTTKWHYPAGGTGRHGPGRRGDVAVPHRRRRPLLYRKSR